MHFMTHPTSSPTRRFEFCNSRTILCALALAALIPAASLSRAASTLTLCAKGESSYKIVIATNALPSERYAAD